MTAEALDDPTLLDALCTECLQGFTSQEWEDRHADGLEDVHARCCPACGKEDG